MTSSKETTALHYGINLMWINNQIDDGEFVCAGKNRQKMDYILNQLKKWCVANPEAEVNFWYDSCCTNTAAIGNTQQLLDEMSVEIPSPIKLRDIREISFVQNNCDLFLPAIPIYFRVDSLKLIVCAHLMENKKLSSVIFTDFSICDKADAALTKQQLYNPLVLKNLEQYGLVLGEDNMGKVENQFLQMMNTPELVESLKHAINSSLLLAKNKLNEALRIKDPGVLGFLYYAPFDATMARIYIYYLAMKSKSPIKIRADVVKAGNENEWTNYEPEKHGYIMFGNILAHLQRGSIYYDNETHKKIPINKMIKLPDGLNFFPSALDDLSVSRNDVCPGHTGRSHYWTGELPYPSMSKDEFDCVFWSLNSVLSNQITTRPRTSSSMINPAITYRNETVLNRKPDEATSNNEQQEEKNMRGPQ